MGLAPIPFFPEVMPTQIPFDEPMILASQSPRRRQLLAAAGYSFTCRPPADHVECGACSTQPPRGLVAESSWLKAAAIAQDVDRAVILAADTVAVCRGEILGKPRDEDDARRMLESLSGKRHAVLTGVTLWHRPSGARLTRVEETWLRMDPLQPQQLEAFLASDEWIGKAGAFGYQDGLDWVHVEQGLESNVVGLPVERLPEWLAALRQEVDSLSDVQA